MIKELEARIQMLEEKRANIKKSKDNLGEDEYSEFLKGCYSGQRIELLEEIRYLRKLINLLKGE